VLILAVMKRLIGYIRSLPARLTKRRRDDGLTAVEYEAGCLITYEGRAAYVRARQQACYCRRRGSAQGVRFWTAVAVDVDRRAGLASKEPPNSRDSMGLPTRRYGSAASVPEKPLQGSPNIDL
jgi:hypothetical protein